jgi:outer membrane protein OmpA-like peptidoglycan-associated protein
MRYLSIRRVSKATLALVTLAAAGCQNTSPKFSTAQPVHAICADCDWNKSQPYIVLFNYGSASVNNFGRAVVDQVMHDAKLIPPKRISIVGHADRVGSEADNMRLSLRRAKTLRDTLIQHGIAPEIISVSGRGETEPSVPTYDGVEERANRNAMILFE